MVLGLSLQAFTILHVIISIIELAAGAAVLIGLLTGSRSSLTAVFLVTAALTDITGFLFPFHGVTPGIILGVLSLVVIGVATLAFYSFHLQGAWRAVYAISAVMVLYFDAFVAVAQAFQKVPALHALAPTGKEPAFAAAQGLLLVVAIVAGFFCVRRFRLEQTA